MTIHWRSVRDESPLAMQIIEKVTGFTYDAAYQILLDENKKPFTYAHIEGFFDKQGWLLTIIPLDYPNWNGIISDTNGQQILNDHAIFEGVKDRNHAKSLLAGIAIKYFNQKVKEMITIPEDALFLSDDDLHIEAKEKELNQLLISDFKFDQKGLILNSHFVVFKKDGKQLILKNRLDFPPQGLVI